MIGSPKHALIVALAFMAVVLVLGLVLAVRCPAGSIPDLARAVGSWWQIRVAIV